MSTSSETPETNVPAKRAWRALLAYIAVHPLAILSSYVIGIVGLILSIYFYKVSQRYPELSYLVSPIKSVVVGANDAKGLNITVRGKPLEGSLTAAQVMIWNAGKDPIEPAMMLEPLVLEVEGTKILQATIPDQTRPNIEKMKLDESNLAHGKVTISWNILEEGDAGIVQLVYQGDANTNIIATATVKGQKGGIKLILPGQLASPTSQRPEQTTRWGTSLAQKIFSVVASLLTTSLMIFILWAGKVQVDRPTKTVVTWILFFVMLGYFLFSVYVLFMSSVRLPLNFCGSCGGPTDAEPTVVPQAPARAYEIK